MYKNLEKKRGGPAAIMPDTSPSKSQANAAAADPEEIAAKDGEVQRLNMLVK